MRLLYPWDFSGKNTEVGCRFLLQGIFSTHESNLCLLHWQADPLPLCHLENTCVYISVQFSCSVVSYSLQPHGLQHTRLPCPSPTPGSLLKLMSMELVIPSISSSVVPFSSCLESFPATGSFPMSNSSHQVAQVLEFQLQHQSFQ